ncbi:MAG: M20/M25/M40 family metallo-hydrolase [Nitrososphaerota archaeon]|jgi:acetylornithine deacetylase/succinyl-diaminopimelate desuccinylase-like protein|uniref:M20/M25/M40 family metallo-hydrolase n=1 Tax=Candidatus Bathycorpusculum sp. TaxID=2994959 RepID=UPI0028265798|nr:M20/M25/M40 family metallo-hydrolase [Candidatus Termitimicrobium sp.]MCL2431944.1 M20/M25/M40 family metallo-hydrolase [Candidatus Termitimicrobium sp.]MDR0493868.1 M20/M25/M40 family metallo-hydrolase [Nitrososphaerota archaeon]
MPIQIQNNIKEEITNFLSNLIRINTTNPPGNETQAARFIAEYLAKDGLKSEIFESTPGRGSIITRLKGTGKKPNLLLLSHLDVVTANPKEWTVDPFAGTIKDGFVYGRGAIDMKGMTAIEVITLKLLKQNNIPIKGDVVLAATADEEHGGEAGAGYLIHKHKDKIWCPYLLNEGGGTAIPQNNRNIYPIQTAEKGILWFKIKAKGTPGHGSTPNMADNAIERINKVITKLGNYQPPTVYVSTLNEFLTQITQTNPQLKDTINRLLTNPTESEQILNELAQKDKTLAEEIRPRIKTTITPTIIHGGMKENIIPSECEVVFDCRVLPNQSVTKTLDSIKDMLKDIGDGKLSYEIIQMHDGNQSTTQTPLYDTIKNVLQEADPGCNITPTLTTGGTDSRFFRETGSICYGFHPVRPEEPNGEYEKRMHGIDERLSIDNLVWGTSIFYETVKRFMT